jgi:hypothetical protein
MLAEAKRSSLLRVSASSGAEASQTEIVKLAERQAQGIIDGRAGRPEMRLEMEDWADGTGDARGRISTVPRRGAARQEAAARALRVGRRRRQSSTSPTTASC